MAFVFLEKQPVYQCLNKDTGQWQTEGCDRAQFCDDSLKISWRVDWEASESIRNLIYQLNFYCAPDYMMFLAWHCGGVLNTHSTWRYARQKTYLHAGYLHSLALYGWNPHCQESYYLFLPHFCIRNVCHCEVLRWLYIQRRDAT
jgi:hypothetical protein